MPAARGEKIFLLGCETGVAEKAAEKLRFELPKIEIVGTHPGFFETERVIDKINDISTTSNLGSAAGAGLTFGA